MVKNPKFLFKIENFILIVQIFALFDFAIKNCSRYQYHFFINELKFQIKQKKLVFDMDIFFNVFNDYYDNNYTGQGLILLFVIIIHFFNFIFLIIGFCIHKNKTNTNCINICFPIFFFSLNLLTSFFEFYFEFFYECSELGLTEAQLNLFEGFKEQIITNLNYVKKRIIYMKIYSVLLIICNIIHIIFTIILRKATKNIKPPVPIKEKEEKDVDEIVEDNNENSDNFIKFDNEINGPPTMKFIKYINTKLGV